MLIAVAALLGVVGGTAVGYGVQAERPPTPLPPLSQRDLAYPPPLPKGKAAAEPLTAKDDRRVRTDGDLRKLLVAKPAGARKAVRPWLGDGLLRLDAYAMGFGGQDYVFESLAEADVRRIAATSWDEGEHRETDVVLIQFRSGTWMSASEYADEQMSYLDDESAMSDGAEGALKGSGTGRYYVVESEEPSDYWPLHRAWAIAYRGDVAVEVSMSDTSPISEKDIRTLAERQLGRL
ncbi:hypothetical protein AB0M39_12950 [Streptomyces sp. NPDC051907]|uniref:hypothetical protein n=1 Tax=Streptomyces sp. NPDC051907 TaxID=3155284 RepID=UPI00341425DD